jgi:hypothetical protein
MVDITDPGYSPLQATADTRTNLLPLMQAANQSYELQRQRMEQGQGIANQGYEQATKAYNEQGADYSALKDLLLKTQERLGSLQYSPGPKEQALRVMSAMAGEKPSLQGMAGVGAAAGQAAAQNLQEQRQGELMKQQLMAKYGIDAAQAGMMAHQLQAQLAQNMIQRGQQLSGNASTAMNAALGRDTAMQSAIMAAQNKPVQVNVNGQATPNQALINEKAQEAGAVAKSKLQAQLEAMDASGGLEKQAEAIAHYQMPPPSGMVARSPMGLALNGRVMEINPDYQATKYPTIQSAAKEWFSGAQNSPGSKVRSMNVAMSHLDTLRELSDALNNGDMKRVNQVGQWWAAETGNPAPTNFDTAKQIVQDELINAIVARSGGVTDRVEAAKHVPNMNSPAVMSGAIDTEQKLLAGQLGGLKHQYESAELDKHYGPFEKLLMSQVTDNPITNKVLGGQHATPPLTNAKGWALHKDAKGNMAYVAPDGKSFEPVR